MRSRLTLVGRGLAFLAALGVFLPSESMTTVDTAVLRVGPAWSGSRTAIRKTDATPPTKGPAIGLPAGPWSMFKNNVARTGRTPLLGPQTSSLIWHKFQEITLSIQSSPVLAWDGTIYAGSDNGYFFAFRPNGTVKWVFNTGRYITASPAIARDGTIYMVSEDGIVRAFRPNGSLKWRYRMESYAGPSASPAVGSDGTIYIGSDRLYAFNPGGTVKWTFDPPSWIQGPPAIATDGTIYVPSAYGNFFALNPDGSVKWHFPTGSYGIASAPAVDEDGTIYANSMEHILYAFNPDGSLKWSYRAVQAPINDVPSSPAIALDGTIYFAAGNLGNGYVFALNPDGSLKWRYWTGSYHSAPSVGGDGTIYIGDGGYGYVYALNPDGTLKWSYYNACGILACYIRTAPAIGFGRRLYVGSYNGFLALGP